MTLLLILQFNHDSIPDVPIDYRWLTRQLEGVFEANIWVKSEFVVDSSAK